MLFTDAEKLGPWIFSRVDGLWVPGRSTTIGRMHKGRIVAGVAYEDFTGTNIVCHIAGDGSWATPGFLGAIFYYPFVQLMAKRITAPVASNNAKSIKLVERMGFVLEATLCGAVMNGDLLLYRMFRDDCKYLGARYGKKFASAAASA